MLQNPGSLSGTAAKCTEIAQKQCATKKRMEWGGCHKGYFHCIDWYVN